MKKSYLIVCLFFIVTLLHSADSNKKRILYVNSYHSGLAWSDGITQAIKENLPISQIDLKILEMDTKRKQSEEFKKLAAFKAKKEIEDFKPDLVITSDDNAAKYLIVPYFYNSNIPFVFCGINWDASEYGFPTKNVTGMIEVQLIPQMIELLKKYSNGDKIGFLKNNSLSSKKEVEYFEKALHVKIDKRFAQNIDEWKKEFLDLQNSVDIVLIGTGTAIPKWNEEFKSIKKFALKNTKVPTASWDKEMSSISLLTYATMPSEQGEWAAKTAMEILKGKSVSSFDLVKNEKAKSYINTTLLKKLNIIFSFDTLDIAELVE